MNFKWVPAVINWTDEQKIFNTWTHYISLGEIQAQENESQQQHISQKTGKLQKPVSTEGWSDKAEFIYFINM